MLAVRAMPRLFLCPDLFTVVLCSQGALHPKSEGLLHIFLLMSAPLTSIAYIGL